MKREHLLLLKGKIEDKISDLKALLSLIKVWEEKKENGESRRGD